MSQNIPLFTTGSRSAGATLTTTVAAQGQTTLAITTNGATDTIKQGDVFTIADCYAVNPQTRESTGSLFQFVALADATAVGNAVTVTVDPISWGSDQALATVNSVPTATKAITWYGGVSTAYPQNLALHKEALAFVTADLPLPKGMDMATRVVHNGLSLRFLRGFDIVNDRFVSRLDILYGYKLVRPEMACRIWG